jgi:hypothetical protein
VKIPVIIRKVLSILHLLFIYLSINRVGVIMVNELNIHGLTMLETYHNYNHVILIFVYETFKCVIRSADVIYPAYYRRE